MRNYILFSISFFSFFSFADCPSNQSKIINQEIDTFILDDCKPFLFPDSQEKNAEQKNKLLFCECENRNLKKIPFNKNSTVSSPLAEKAKQNIFDQSNKAIQSITQAFTFLNSLDSNQEAIEAAQACSLTNLNFDECNTNQTSHVKEFKEIFNSIQAKQIEYLKKYYNNEKSKSCLSNFEIQSIGADRENILLQVSFEKLKTNKNFSNPEIQNLKNSSFRISTLFNNSKFNDLNGSLNEEIFSLKNSCQLFYKNLKKLACSPNEEMIPSGITSLNMISANNNFFDEDEGTATTESTSLLAPFCSEKNINNYFDKSFLPLKNVSLETPPVISDQILEEKNNLLSNCFCPIYEQEKLEKLLDENKCKNNIESAKEIKGIGCSGTKIYCSHILALNQHLKNKMLSNSSPQGNLALSTSGRSITDQDNKNNNIQTVALNNAKSKTGLDTDLMKALIKGEKNPDISKEGIPASKDSLTPPTNIAQSNHESNSGNIFRKNDKENEEAFFKEIEKRMLDSAIASSQKSSSTNLGFNNNEVSASTNNYVAREIPENRDKSNQKMGSIETEENEEDGNNHSKVTKKAKPLKRRPSDTAQEPAYQTQENAPVNYVTNNSILQNTTPIAPNNSISQNSADVLPTDSIKEKEVSKTPIGLPAKNQDGTIKNATNSTTAGNNTSSNSSPSSITINSKPSNSSNVSGGGNRETEVVFNEKAVDKEFVVQPDKLKPEEVKALRGLLDSGEPFNIRLSQHENFKVKVVPGANNEISLIAPTQMEANPEYQKFVANMKDFIQSQTRGGNLKKLKLMFTTT